MKFPIRKTLIVNKYKTTTNVKFIWCSQNDGQRI